MKNKFPIILLVLFTIFAIIKIAFTNSMIYMEKKDYTTFEQTIGELKYSLDNGELDSLKSKYMDILFQINSLNVKQAGDSGENNPETKNIYGNENLKAKLLDFNSNLNKYSEKYLVEQEIIKDEKTRRIIFLLSWLLLATGLALVEWSHSKIIAILLFTIITVMAVFSFFSMTKAQEKNNESDPKVNDSVDSNMMANRTRKIICLLSWFLFAIVTAVITWRYSKIIAALVFIAITAVSIFSFFSIIKVEGKKQ